MQPLSTPDPLHLYVHIPFCVHKCHYCDFNSHERAAPDWQGYGNSLIAELTHWASTTPFKDRPVSSIFFGGGTPSLAPPSLIASVIRTAKNLFVLDNDAEITLEANPGTVDTGHFEGYRQAGINRLSIGMQSLNDAELKWLERIHSGQQSLAAYQTGRDAGFDNINLDLMYGLADQPLSSWLDTLQAAIDLAPEHLSCYQLTVEPHTRLAASHANKPYPLPDDELSLSFFRQTRSQLKLAGYQAYEISNFSRPGKACLHNDGYWLYHDYIGIGAGAAGKWTTDSSGTARYSNIRTPERYASEASDSGSSINNSETLSVEQAAAEAVWLGLRRAAGVDRSCFRHRFHSDAWQRFADQLQPWYMRGMLEVDDVGIRLSEEGLPMADAIAASVL